MWPDRSQQSYPHEQHPYALRRDIDALERRVSQHDQALATAKHYLQIAGLLLVVGMNFGREATLELLLKLLKGGAP